MTHRDDEQIPYSDLGEVLYLFASAVAAFCAGCALLAFAAWLGGPPSSGRVLTAGSFFAAFASGSYLVGWVAKRVFV